MNVIKVEVSNLLDADDLPHLPDIPLGDGLIHVVPKKRGTTVITNEDNELIPERLVTGRKPPSPALIEHLLTEGCLSVFAMLLGLSKDMMLKWCEDTNLVLNWEKCHFMVKDSIVLGHKIFKSGIKVDRAKVDVISKLPPPTMVKGIRSFLGHDVFYRRFIKDFPKIARPMTHLLEKDTPFFFSSECQSSFEILKKQLTKAIFW
ncbi:hypothetical protein Tco_0551653 [Tanacetum coccineum]